MKVLIACEFSGTVRNAFRRRGHDAWSCDLFPADDSSEFHIQGDCREHLAGWDLIVMHPPCQFLCSSGLHWNKRTPGRSEKTDEALAFVRELMDAPCKSWALENPVGCIGTQIRPYDQLIQPWMFGHNASKKTCLWLKGLPALQETKIVPPQGWSNVTYAMHLGKCELCLEPWCDDCGDHYSECNCVGPQQDGVLYKKIDGVQFGCSRKVPPKPVWENQTPSGQNKLGPSKDRWKLRSKTYEGIAEAMAEQWGNE